MMENFSEIIPHDETAEYLRTKKSTLSKFARKDKILSVKIEIGKKDDVIIGIPYNQKLIKKAKTISTRKHLTINKQYRLGSHNEKCLLFSLVYLILCWLNTRKYEVRPSDSW